MVPAASSSSILVWPHLVEGVPRELEEALASEHDGVVRQRRVGDDEVLLGCLQRLHQ